MLNMDTSGRSNLYSEQPLWEKILDTAPQKALFINQAGRRIYGAHRCLKIRLLK